MRAMRRVALVSLLVLGTGACAAFGRSAERLQGSVPSPPTASSEPSPTTSASDAATPAVVVESPLAEAEVASPLVVRGTADVFEGVVAVRLLDANGQLLAGMDVQARCGTGCRGRFEARLHFFTETRQDATLEVYGTSGLDGPPVGLVRIPLTVVP